jgi:hypothetical protein
MSAQAHAQSADPELTSACLPKPTLPWPTCVPAANTEEHALVTLRRAQALVAAQQFAEAAQALTESQQQLEGSADVGLVVRVRSLQGEALLGLRQLSAADAALRAASALWASENALTWIRRLPSGEVSQRAVQRAADAAARAVLRLAELHWRIAELEPPVFTQGTSPQPFAPRRDAELSRQERALRQAWAQRQRTAFVRYFQEQFAPWLIQQRAAVEAAEREFQQVYLVPPTAAPEWRVAVAANMGSLWGRLTDWQRKIGDSCGIACDEVRTRYYGTFDDSWAPAQQLARSAFEACITLSRKYRLVSEYTLVCENWLAENYRAQYSRLDEYLPTADWTATEAMPAWAPSPR